MNRADDCAALLAELVERGKTSGRPHGDEVLASVLDAALDPYELARLSAVARARLGAVNGARARQAAIEAGHLRPHEAGK
jgi:hypothetical protein